MAGEAHDGDVRGDICLPYGFVYGTYRCAVVAAFLLETAEVMRPEKMPCRRVHPFHVYGTAAPVRKTFHERIFSEMDKVMIFTGYG